MSADEIRKLAEDCEKEARHIDEDAGVAFSYGDLRMKDVFDAISKTERQKAAALLAYAAMVERCDRQKSHFDGLLEGKDYKLTGATLHQVVNTEKSIVDYILRGDAGKEEKGVNDAD